VGGGHVRVTVTPDGAQLELHTRGINEPELIEEK
jgi:hypothetical protein